MEAMYQTVVPEDSGAPEGRRAIGDAADVGAIRADDEDLADPALPGERKGDRRAVWRPDPMAQAMSPISDAIV
jgi:hypothetical protein